MPTSSSSPVISTEMPIFRLRSVSAANAHATTARNQADRERRPTRPAIENPLRDDAHSYTLDAGLRRGVPDNLSLSNV
jgi:hypothetical protein